MKATISFYLTLFLRRAHWFILIFGIAAAASVTVADIPSSAYPTPAKRPLNSRLDCARLEADFGIKAPDWQAGLAEVLRDLDGQ